MPLGKRTTSYSTPVVLPDDSTVRTVLRNEDGGIVYPDLGGQAIGVMSMIGLLESILHELTTMNVHLAALSGEKITEA